MDQLTISRRAKSACEILEEATLAARFPFDSGTTLLDYGPNAVTTTASSYSLLSSGHSLQAMSFTGTTSSYFQASGFTGFSINNQAFSFSLWVRPQSRSGSLVHLSTSSNGVGTWCTSLLGFASNGSLVAQTHNGAMLSVQTATLLPLSSSWTHVVQTWSSTNGLRLYVNNTLVASRSSATSFLATGIVPNYVTLANALTAPGTCLAGAINMGPFQGAIDDFSIYFRELTSADVCALYNT